MWSVTKKASKSCTYTTLISKIITSKQIMISILCRKLRLKPKLVTDGISIVFLGLVVTLAIKERLTGWASTMIYSYSYML